jgi:hypothetical protein
MLSLAISPQRFKSVTWRNAKIIQGPALIQQAKFSQRDILDVWRQFPAPPSRPDQFRFGIGKAL